MKTFRYSISLIAALICPSLSFSQDTTRTVIQKVSASGTPTFSDSSWVVSAEDTRSLIAEDAADFLVLLPSVSVIDYGSLGQFSLFSFRGASPQSAKIFFDDMQLLEPIHGIVHVANIPINVIDQIRLSRTGERSGTGGLILKSLPFSSERPRSKVIFRAGDWGYTDIGIALTMPVSKRSTFLFSADRTELDGFRPATRHKGAHVFSKLSYSLNPKIEFDYTAFLTNNKVEVPAPVLPDLAPLVSEAERREKRLDQNLSVKVGERFNARWFFSRIEQQSSDDTLLFKNRNYTFGGEMEQRIAFGSQRLSFSGGARLDDLNSGELGDQSDWLAHGVGRVDFSFSNQKQFSLQLRVEKHQDFSIAVMPSANFSYPFSDSVTFRIGAQMARRYPSFAERFWPTQFFRGDPKLDSERRAEFELGVASRLPSGVSFEAALFTHRVDDWIGNAIVDTSAQLFGPVNSNQRTISGLDFKLNWKFSRFGQLGLTGSYWHVWENDLIKQLLVPEFKMYGFVEGGRYFFQRYVLIKLRLMGRKFGEHYGWEFDNASSFPILKKVGNNAVFDGQISFEFSAARLLLSMENIFDRRYQLTPGFFMPPKTFRFAIEWEFWD